MSEADGPGDGLFWRLAAPRIARGEAERGTMMGHPCLRADGDFVAMPETGTGALVVRHDAERVAALVDEGVGAPFAPAGRVFREWVVVAEPDEDHWSGLLEEALDG